MCVTWGATEQFVPTRGTNMSREIDKKNGDRDGNGTLRQEETNEKHGMGIGTKDSDPFRRAPKIVRTPPPGCRGRINSCSDINADLAKIPWKPGDKKEKRKKVEEDSPPSQIDDVINAENQAMDVGEVLTMRDIEELNSGSDIRKDKEKETRACTSTGATGDLSKWVTEESCDLEDMGTLGVGLEHMLRKISMLSTDLECLIKKNPNTKTEIKKISKEIYTVAAGLCKKGERYLDSVKRNLKEGVSKERKDTVSMATQVERKERKRQTKKERVLDIRERLVNSLTFRELEDVLHEEWPEEAFKEVKTEVRTLGFTDNKEDLIVVTNGSSLSDGFDTLLGKVYPELGGVKEERLRVGELEHVQRVTKIIASCSEAPEKERKCTYLMPWGEKIQIGNSLIWLWSALAMRKEEK